MKNPFTVRLSRIMRHQLLCNEVSTSFIKTSATPCAMWHVTVIIGLEVKDVAIRELHQLGSK